MVSDIGISTFNKVKKNLLNMTNSLMSRKDEYFIITSYLPKSIDFQLQIKLGQFPKLWQEISVNKHIINQEMRQKIQELTEDGKQNNNNFLISSLSIK